MSTASELALAIAASISDLKHGSLAVWGDFFGKPYDNNHVVVSAGITGPREHLFVRFDEGETLEVWDPGEFAFSPKVFWISTASRVRWEWFYYGRPKTPENRFFIQHEVEGGAVRATSDATWAPTQFEPSVLKPAVVLLNGFDD